MIMRKPTWDIFFDLAHGSEMYTPFIKCLINVLQMVQAIRLRACSPEAKFENGSNRSTYEYSRYLDAQPVGTGWAFQEATQWRRLIEIRQRSIYIFATSLILTPMMVFRSERKVKLVIRSCQKPFCLN